MPNRNVMFCFCFLLLSSGLTKAQDAPESVAGLLVQIADEDAEVSQPALERLRRLSADTFSESDIEALVRAVGHENEFVQKVAVFRLEGVQDTAGKLVLEQIYDQEAKILKRPNPRYPQKARLRGISGRVDLNFMVDNSGRPISVRVMRSIPVLDQAALDCLQAFEFAPAVYKGRPAPSIMNTSIHF